MRRIIYILFPIFLSGCGSFQSVQSHFSHEHPGATILSQTSDDAIEHQRGTTTGHRDIGFVYRDADGTEHQEVWHYTYSNHGWQFVKKEQIR